MMNQILRMSATRAEKLAARWLKTRSSQSVPYRWPVQFIQDPDVYKDTDLAEAFIAGYNAALAENETT